MRKIVVAFLLLLTSASVALAAPDARELRQRRQRAAAAFHDGLLLIHSKSNLDLTADGFRQDPAFYYFTGLQDAVPAVLVIDGATAESWLFFGPQHPTMLMAEVNGSSPEPVPQEISPEPETHARFGFDPNHVFGASELPRFLEQRASKPVMIYFTENRYAMRELSALPTMHMAAPLWIAAIHQRFPSFPLKSATRQVSSLMDVQSPSELASVRVAAKTSIPALLAGMRAIRDGVSQRTVELAVANACWQNGARGVSFWPWAMAGKNSVFPRSFASLSVYDHLDSVMHSGDLVRLDIGCEYEHYGGDLGRTVPVSGRYTPDQRETWNIFVAAYQAGVRTFRAGVTEDQVFESWRSELQSHRAASKSAMAQRAIDSWSDRKNVPYWQVHAMNLDAAALDGPLQAGTTIDFEPIAQIDGQGFYLEDMFLITATGADILTPGVPYTADEIEAAMR